MKMLKLVLRILPFAWLVFCIAMSISGLFASSEGELTEKDKVAVRMYFKPSIHFIDSFYSASHRLPEPRTFSNWRRLKDLDIEIKEGLDSIAQPIVFDRIKNDTAALTLVQYIRNDKDLQTDHPLYPKSIDWNKDYVLIHWRGEWDIYYSSWDGKYIRFDYSSSEEKMFYLFIAILIGLVPLGVSRFFIKDSKKSKSMQS